jgi:UDP-GlcNAc:undecaprenyl-phosphate/decaprenyl-phosphate GlcNAc-1-phosphate transferase
MLAFIFGNQFSVGEILRHYWMILPVAFGVSLLANPICRKVAFRLKIVDYPDQKVKTHAAPTAYLGGVGILAGFLSGLFIGLWVLFRNKILIEQAVTTLTPSFTPEYPNWLLLTFIAFGAMIACAVGVLDDILDLKPHRKLIGQAIAASTLIFAGIYPDLSHVFAFVGIPLPHALNVLLGIVIVFFFILGASNSLNLLDGLDGLCAGVTVIITSAFLLLTVALATWAYSPVGDPVRLILCLSLVGATLGFLPLNRHPAKIFMGDAGSMLLGFVSGTLMILLMTETIGRWSVGAIVIFGLPILDTSVSLVRRWVNKRPLFVSDRGHLYDQLMDRGIPLKKTVKINYLLAAVYAVLGLAVAQVKFRYGLIAAVVIAIVSAVAVWRGGFLKMPPFPTQGKSDSNAPGSFTHC